MRALFCSCISLRAGTMTVKLSAISVTIAVHGSKYSLSDDAAAQGTKCKDEVADAPAANVIHSPYSPIASTPLPAIFSVRPNCTGVFLVFFLALG